MEKESDFITDRVSKGHALVNARRVMSKYLALLAPVCERISEAGSVRRRVSEVHDIEIVCIPKRVLQPRPDLGDLFNDTGEEESGRLVEWDARLKQCGEHKTGKFSGKYICFMTPEGIKLDLFTATPDNWGYILAIRTGSARFSHEVLGKGWVRAGFVGVDGQLCRRGEPAPTPVIVSEEEDFFKMIGVPFVPPEKRSW